MRRVRPDLAVKGKYAVASYWIGGKRIAPCRRQISCKTWCISLLTNVSTPGNQGALDRGQQVVGHEPLLRRKIRQPVSCLFRTDRYDAHERSSTCSPQDQQYVHVICGGVIHLSIIEELRIAKWEHSNGWICWGVALSRCHQSLRWKHACYVDVWFWVDPSGISPR